MRLCCALVFPEEEEKNNKSSGTGQIRFQTAFLSKEHTKLSFSFARLWTTNDENTHAIRVSSFYQKRKNDDALKVVLPSPELARSRRRRRPPRSRDRCPSFFVRRPLYFDVATNSTTTTTFRRRALLVEERTRKEKGRESPAVLLSRDDAFLGAAAAVERKEGKK